MPELIDPHHLCDIYSDGQEYENLGACFRTTFFTYNRGAGGVLTRLVVAKVVRPRTVLEVGSFVSNVLDEQSLPLVMKIAAGGSH